MAKKTAIKKGIPHNQLHKIWSAIKTEDWLDIARAYSQNQFVRVADDRLMGLCVLPTHHETTPSFHIYTDRHYFKCYGCGHYSANPIELAAFLTGKPIGEAVIFLYERFKLAFLSKRALNEVTAQRQHQQMKEALFAACHDLLLQALLDPASHPSAQKALKWLTEERQIPADTLYALPVGITSDINTIAELLLKQHHDAMARHKSGTPEPINHRDGAVAYLRDYIRDPAYNGAIVWPLHTNFGEISRLKIRVPDSAVGKQILIPEDEYEDQLGLFGVGWEPYHDLLDSKMLAKTKPKEVAAVLTEGELDVMSYMAMLVKSGAKPLFPFYSVGGSGGAPYIDSILKPLGVKVAYLVGDAPYKGSAGGDPTVMAWLENLVDVQAKIFKEWDQMAPCGDLDEAVHQLTEPVVTDVIWHKRKDNYELAPVWIAAKADLELEKIDGDDSRQLTETATKFGKHLKNVHEVQRFVDQIAATYPMLNPLSLRRSILASSDNEAGFIESCAAALNEQLFPIGTIVRAGNRCIIAEHRERKRIHTIRLDSEQSISQELAPLTGKVANFIEAYVGFPHFLENLFITDALIYRSIDTRLKYYVKEAVQDMAKDLPDISSALCFRQGYHFITAEEAQTDENLEYIVCGRDIFGIERDGPNTKYRRLEGPADKGVIFDTGYLTAKEVTPWYPGGLDTQVLEEGRNVDLAKLYDDLVRFFNVGFQFKRHEVTCELLAATILSFPIMSAFPRQILMFFTGDTSSGKTTLLSVFSGVGAHDIQLLLCSQGLEYYTPASVRNLTNADSRVLTLDEFEFTDPQRQRQVEEIMNWVRGLVTDKAISAKATPEGSVTISHHKLSIIFSAISGAEKPQDLNRLLIIEMDKVVGRDAPETILGEEFGIEAIETMAKQIATAVYPHVPELQKVYKEIARDFSALQAMVSFPIEYRYASSLFAALAMMKHIGKDWKNFFKRYIAQNRDLIYRATTMTESDIYLNALLYNTAVYQPETKSNVTIAYLLANESKRRDINTSSTGVYLDEQTNLLLIMLDQAVARLLSPAHNQQKNVNITQLRETLMRHSQALKPQEVRDSGILRRIIPYLGANIEEKHVVVFHADPWLVSHSEMAEIINTQMKEVVDKKEADTIVVGDFNKGR